MRGDPVIRLAAVAVVNRDVSILLAFGGSNYLQIDLEGAVELLLLLEFGSLFFELFDLC